MTAVVSPHKDRMVLDFDEFLTPLLLPCEIPPTPVAHIL